MSCDICKSRKSFFKVEPLKSGDEKRGRLLEIIRKIDIDEDDDLDESELVQERFPKDGMVN